MTHHGFIGSLSTSALLVGAAVSILLVVSAIVAFEGWPGPSGDAPTRTFLLGERERSDADSRPRPELVLDPPARERTSSSEGSGGAVDSTDVAAGPVGGVAPAPAPTPSAPEGSAVPPPESGAPGPVPVGGGDTLGGGSGGVGGIGGTVDRATDAVSGGVDGVAPVTDRVNELVEGSTGAVNDLTGGR